MTDKQKKIKEAYGRFYDAQRHHYSINGWTDPEHYTEKEMEEMMQEINMEFGEHRCRPKSLSCIEDNNGWIKIESEKDLPKENIDCFYRYVVDKHFSNAGEKIQTGRFCLKSELHRLENYFTSDGIFSFPWEKVTHYQPVQKPEPPIY